MINFLLLFALLRRKLGGLQTKRVITSLFRTGAASLAMGLIGWYLLRGEMWTSEGNVLMKAGYLSGTIVLSMLTYVLITRVLGSEELGFVLGFVRQKFKRA
jgi:peptidoglycan biosynthesis protein MviN/MurJ (putative lipid II flippase)